MDLGQLFALADAHQPPEYQLPLRLQPFIPDDVSAAAAPKPPVLPSRSALLKFSLCCSPPRLQVPAIGAPCAFTAPPRPDGEPDFLGLTVLDEPALLQSDPAALALRLRRQQGAQGPSADAAPPLGWVAHPAGQAQQLGSWIEQVEALHAQVGAGAGVPWGKESRRLGTAKPRLAEAPSFLPTLAG